MSRNTYEAFMEANVLIFLLSIRGKVIGFINKNSISLNKLQTNLIPFHKNLAVHILKNINNVIKNWFSSIHGLDIII